MIKKIIFSILFSVVFSISGIAQDNSSSKGSNSELNINVVTPPIFNGQGNPDTALGKYVQKNYTIPTKFKGSGTVIVDFIIDNTGKIGQIKIVNDLGSETGNEAVKLLKRMPNWTPAYDKDRNPIPFSHSLKIKLNVM
jgi:hypothetical protein